MKKAEAKVRTVTKGHLVLIQAIQLLGGQKSTADYLGVKYQSVQGWMARGLPRTEWTGETSYAETIQRLTSNKVQEDHLLDRAKATKAEIRAMDHQIKNLKLKKSP